MWVNLSVIHFPITFINWHKWSVQEKSNTNVVVHHRYLIASEGSINLLLDDESVILTSYDTKNVSSVMIYFFLFVGGWFLAPIEWGDFYSLQYTILLLLCNFRSSSFPLLTMTSSWGVQHQTNGYRGTQNILNSASITYKWIVIRKWLGFFGLNLFNQCFV